MGKQEVALVWAHMTARGAVAVRKQRHGVSFSVEAKHLPDSEGHLSLDLIKTEGAAGTEVFIREEVESRKSSASTEGSSNSCGGDFCCGAGR